MSNLHTATLAIEAEIAHARQGMEYYASRIKALEQALAELTHVAEIPAKMSEEAKPRGRRAKSAAGGAKRGRKAKAGSRAGAPAAEAAPLPSTGKDYWPNLVTDQPQTAPAILAAAIDKLGFEPTREQVKKLSQRQTFALNTLVKTGVIQDSGTGRERVFFKKS